jgi:putative aminopeptidase FrvX
MTKKKTTLLPAVPAPGLPQHIKAGKRNLNIDVRFMIDFLVRLLNTPSPTGYTAQAQALVRETLADLRDTRFNAKGDLIATWHGKSTTHPRALTAHVDTLGAMVKEIDAYTGRLRLSRLGGVTWNSVEGEGCSIVTAGGRVYRGTILPRKASVHVHSGPEVEKFERSDANMEIRLDAKVRSAQDTRQLGIDVGDFVVFDPRVEVIDTAIRSRHLDDKASGLPCGSVQRRMRTAPAQNTTIWISHFEELATARPPASRAKRRSAARTWSPSAPANSDEYP